MTRRLRSIATIVVLLAAYALSVFFFLREDHPAHALDAGAHDIALGLKIGLAEFQKESATFHIAPAAGRLLDGKGHLKQDLELALDPGTGPVSHVFRANMPITPWTVPIAIDSGDILNYPLDRYTIDFEIEAKSAGQNIKLTADLEHVPHGLKARLDQEPSDTGGGEMTVSLARSGSNLFVAGLSTVSLVLVTLGACAVAWHVVYRGRKIEFSMMTWTAALLFVIPAVRGALPGSPPTGALIDFLIFFWLQAFIVVATASMVLTWLRRST